MAEPQPTDAHLRIAHSINEQLMVSHFSEQQRRILDFILRLSWGCGKKTAIIPHQSDFECVGVGRTHIKEHLDWLIEAKIIVRDGEHYSFNKDFDMWRCSRALQYTPEKMAELIKINLNYSYGKRNPKNKGVTENVTRGLRKTEQSSYGKRNPPTPNLATPKEKLNKDIYKDKDSIILPEWIDKETWESFLEMRKRKRAVPTEKAKELLIKELEKLKNEGHDSNEVLNQSIMRNYTGVFPLKGSGTLRQDPKINPDKFIKGRYGHMVQR